MLCIRLCYMMVIRIRIYYISMFATQLIVLLYFGFLIHDDL